MISKKTRRATGSVENLKQGGITAVKGIDETASPLDSEHVLYLENLDVDYDGGLILRKPVFCIKDIPNLAEKQPEKVCYLFDKKYKLIANHSDPDSVLPKTVYRFAVYENDSSIVKCRVCWTGWEDGTSYSLTLDNESSSWDGILDFTNACFTNTPTSTVCTSTRVKVSDGVSNISKIYNSDLYDPVDDSTDVYLYRMVIITKSKDPGCVFDFNIITPEMSSINASDTLRLDLNLNADNPYAIRDTYNSAAPTIKSIIPYARAQFVNGIPILLGESSWFSDECSDSQVYTEAYTGNVPRVDDVHWIWSNASTSYVKSVRLEYRGNHVSNLHWNVKNFSLATSLFFTVLLECEILFGAVFYTTVVKVSVGSGADSPEPYVQGKLALYIDKDSNGNTVLNKFSAEYPVNVSYYYGIDTSQVLDEFNNVPSWFFSKLLEYMSAYSETLETNRVVNLTSDYIFTYLSKYVSGLKALNMIIPDGKFMGHLVRVTAPKKQDNTYSLETYSTSPNFIEGIG